MSEPSMVIDEPVATGSIRIELYGDSDAAALALHDARALLGATRTMYGVNERIAAGEGGGFYQQRRLLADGTLIEATTNNGMDMVRIYPAAAPKPTPEPEPKLKPETATHLPYLWLGVRIVSGGLWAEDNWHYNPVDPDGLERVYTNVLHACMWQPPLLEGGERTILSNRESFLPTSDMNLRPVSNLAVLTVPYNHNDYPLYYQTKFIPANSTRRDIDTRVVYTDQRLCLIQRHNTLGIPMLAPDHDPTAPEVTWDFMFVGDPMNALGIDGATGATPGDIFTPHVVPPIGADYFNLLADATGGEYLFKFAVEGRECRRALAEPLVVEMKCIVGRGENRIMKTHTVTMTEATDYFSGLMPKGFFDPGPPSTDPHQQSVRDAGPNRHGTHWWQGMMTAFVPPAQVEVPLDQAIPPSIHFSPDGEVGLPPGADFEPGPYFPPLARCPGGQYFD